MGMGMGMGIGRHAKPAGSQVPKFPEISPIGHGMEHVLFSRVNFSARERTREESGSRKGFNHV